jgi:hypothetical protein
VQVPHHRWNLQQSQREVVLYHPENYNKLNIKIRLVQSFCH